VGINTAIFSRSGGYMGIGFAIPINMAKSIRDQLIKHGEVTRGRLGVYIQDMTKDLAESFGLDKAQGILVTQVMDDSPASKAGLKRGDVIEKLNGEDVGKVAEFRNHIAMTTPDTKVRLDILRDGKEKQLTVTIGKLEKSAEEGTQGKSEGEMPKLGLRLQALTPDLAAQLGYQNEKGVLVVAVDSGSPADLAGIQRGDLIQEIDRKAVTDPQVAGKLLTQNKGKAHLLLVRNGEATRYLTLKIENGD